MAPCQQAPLVSRPFFIAPFEEDLLLSLPRIEAALSERRRQLLGLSAAEQKEFRSVCRFYFVLDANRSELEGTQTFEESEQALNAPQLHQSPSAAGQVTRNMREAVEFLFGPADSGADFGPVSMADFTPSLARQLHSIVCHGLLPNAGAYRSRPARPTDEPDFYYAPPERIAGSLAALFAACRAAAQSGRGSLLETVQLAASFLEQYLAIHPFSDGNGRTGRLLCALLLRPLLPEPLSVCLANPHSRDIYLRCLREARGHGGHPGLLAAYLLTAVDRAAANWSEWLYCCSEAADNEVSGVPCGTM